MGNCVMCGEPVPDGQNVCSMCYGDPGYGNDGYYQDWLDARERRAAEDAAYERQLAEQEHHEAQ